jgi:PiT family inorganic phosphate transporter
MSESISLLGSLLVAFVIGSNDASNALGICIGCQLIKFKKAILLFGLFVLLGITLQGNEVMNTVGRDLLDVNVPVLGVALLVTALLIALSNWKKLPLSSHQIIIGSLTGSGAASGVEINLSALLQIVFSWLISPLGAFFFALISYKIMEKTLSRLPLFRVESTLRILLMLSGFLIAYNTGANELATVLAGATCSGLINPAQACLGGSLLVLLGAALLSPRVIETVGKGITILDPFSGFAAQFGAGSCVLLFTTLGMPVSTTYCIIGGIIGVGVLKGVATVRFDLIRKMLINWMVAPLSAGLICFTLTKALRHFPALFV